MAAIRTEGLTKRFGESIVAVDDLDLDVEDGEIFGFLGPNGAGKSTTINMLLGFAEPTAGRASVLNRDVTSDSRAIRQRIGLLPEGYDVYPNLTGREHVESAIATKGADDDPDALLDRVGLDPDDARRAAGGYSKGMTQRLALGIALVGSPDLLILDEPSGGLDPKGVKLLREIVREEADRGATVFFSSHVLSQVEKVCDRVGILNEGRLVAIDTIDALREELGAGSAVELTVESLPDLEELRSLEGVRDVTASGDVLRVGVHRRDAKVAVVRHVDERSTVRDIEIEDASLEALFERYTNGTTPTDDAGESEASVPAVGGDAS